MRIGRKKDTLRLNGRFLFPRIYMGRHNLTLGETQRRIRLMRQRDLQGIAFESRDDLLVIAIGEKVRAIELYLLPTLTVRQEEWAAIDKDHNVITPRRRAGAGREQGEHDPRRPAYQQGRQAGHRNHCRCNMRKMKHTKKKGRALWRRLALAGNQVPMPFGMGVAVVLSGSMESELITNDVIIVRETNDYAVGDVVV